ncbi:uncharacterized protein LOC131627079 [Vicia villosa]|uniref:uncharacterized protein LOC131627079 n=1 Tax=Vicia villosa TaxID=3911 RepID=UPI00273CDFA7|nr:uncharacterized protein LOC131627079 [Vicia villosa]
MKSRTVIGYIQDWEQSLQLEKFHTRGRYHLIRDDRDQVPWKKIFFHNNVRPQVKFHLCLVLMRKTPTKDRLNKFGILTDKVYCFCQEDETIDHLYFECRYSKRIWETILQWIGYRTNCGKWSIEKEWIMRETNKKGWRQLLLKNAIAETVHMICRVRNEFIFQKKQPDEDCVKQLQYIIVVRCNMVEKLRNHISIETLNIN